MCAILANFAFVQKTKLNVCIDVEQWFPQLPVVDGRHDANLP